MVLVGVTAKLLIYVGINVKLQETDVLQAQRVGTSCKLMGLAVLVELAVFYGTSRVLWNWLV